MLKMYQRNFQTGGVPEYWEDNWGAQQFESQVRFCEADPLRPLFERYVQAGTTMLEGGCGMGQYVSYYTARGAHVVGLDFARETLMRLRRREPDLKLCVGDVAALPFQDDSFDSYYSGGVVEHFEGGVEQALREAHRVLRRDGVLLISVPYLSPLRRMLAFARSDWKFVGQVSVGEASKMGDDWQFFQYAYTPREFRRMLADGGFEVISTQGYAIIWGIYELPLVGQVFANRVGQSRVSGPFESLAKDGLQSSSINQQRSFKSLLKRLIVSEDTTVPVVGIGVRALRWMCANMMMYVCKQK